MATLKERLRADLTTAMKQRATVEMATLRMALAAITTEEVSGHTARELTDAEVVTVLGREVRKRREAAQAFSGAGRAELAEREEAESAVLTSYLPAPLTDAELAELVTAAVARVTADTGAAPTMKQMGVVVTQVQRAAAGRVDGGRVAALVRTVLAG